MEAIEANATARLEEAKSLERDKSWYARSTIVPSQPIFIATTEGVGSIRVRANHIDSALDYFMEQEELKKANAPIK